MKSRLIISAALPFLLLAGTPAQAADQHFNFWATDHTTAAFAGFQFRMNMGDRRPAAPTARFQLGMNHYSSIATGGYGLQRNGTALELGFSNRGRADFYVGGQSLTDMQQRMGIAPLAAAGLALGEVAVGAVAVATLVDERTGCPPGVEVCTR